MKELLLVEDSDADAALVRRAMDSLSIANPVRHFSTGPEAMAYLNTVAQTAAITPPPASILFLDLVLPGMSGLEILEKIAAHPAFEKMLRVVLTNLSDLQTIKRAYSLGAQSFLIKPVQPADLQELIENFPGHWSFNVDLPNPFAKIRRGPRVAAK
jgi:CheY-like chemotaxis protein